MEHLKVVDKQAVPPHSSRIPTLYEYVGQVVAFWFGRNTCVRNTSAFPSNLMAFRRACYEHREMMI